MNFLAQLFVNVLLGHLLAPRKNDFLIHNVIVIELLEKTRHFGKERSITLDQLFHTTEHILLCLFRVTNEMNKQRGVLANGGENITTSPKEGAQDHDRLILHIQTDSFVQDSLGGKLVFFQLLLHKSFKQIQSLTLIKLSVLILHQDIGIALNLLLHAQADSLGTGVFTPIIKAILLVLARYLSVNACGTISTLLSVCAGCWSGGNGVRRVRTTSAVLFAFALLLALVATGLVGRVIENESGQLVSALNNVHDTTCFALLFNPLVLWKHGQFGFRIVAFRTQNKLFDEAIQQFLKVISGVGTINNVSFSFYFHLGLSTKFITKVLGWVRRGSFQSLCNFNHVGNNSFNTIASSFNLGNNRRHLVPIKDVLDVAINVKRHFEDQKLEKDYC
eukprot:m.94638 g.94638  ORF g.94638 m.94638 type:complete len:390 (-) comp21871_c1_seq3:236-1405(-)